MRMESKDRAILYGVILALLIGFSSVCILNYTDTYEKISMAKAGYEKSSLVGQPSAYWVKVR